MSLKELRTKNKLTQKELALITGIPQRTIQDLELDKAMHLNTTSGANLFKLSKALNCTMEDLIDKQSIPCMTFQVVKITIKNGIKSDVKVIKELDDYYKAKDLYNNVVMEFIANKKKNDIAIALYVINNNIGKELESIEIKL